MARRYQAESHELLYVSDKLDKKLQVVDNYQNMSKPEKK